MSLDAASGGQFQAGGLESLPEIPGLAVHDTQNGCSHADI